jgi:hypothetical protein
MSYKTTTAVIKAIKPLRLSNGANIAIGATLTTAQVQLLGRKLGALINGGYVSVTPDPYGRDMYTTAVHKCNPGPTHLSPALVKIARGGVA